MDRSQHPYAQRMAALARSFPTLHKADGLDPWDPDRLDHWAATHPAVTTGSRHAARFVLAVWVGRACMAPGLTEHEVDEDTLYSYRCESPWASGIFDVVDAFGTWDHRHQEAFLAWARDPWWP
jgi:hypothetical protein